MPNNNDDDLFTKEELDKLTLDEAERLLVMEIKRVAGTWLPRLLRAADKLVPPSETLARSDVSVAFLLTACTLAKVRGASEENWNMLCERVWCGVQCEVHPMTKGGAS